MVTISERNTSRKSTMSESPSVDLDYVIDGTSDDFQVKGLMLSTAPSSYDGLPLNSISIQPMDRPDLWEATATYSKRDKDGEDDADPEEKLAYAFDTSGGSMKITQALEQTSYQTADADFGIGAAPPDFGLAINVSSNNEVDGVDIVIPKLSWQETHTFPASSITTDWVRDLARNTGKTNDDDFRGFDPGEVLFLGASGTYSDKHVAVTYKFEASENMEDQNVGGITVDEKRGYDYLWCYYFEKEDEDAKELVPSVGAVYVCKVYESFSFSALGIAKSSMEKKDDAEDRDRPGFGGGGEDVEDPDFG
jgi:hypothetical protein